MDINKIIELYLLLNTCLLASNCIKIEKCAIWNKISKCFRLSRNNTHCYETKPNGTYCCTESLIFNDFYMDDNSEINFEKCISYSENEHNKFVHKVFVLLMGLSISIPIGIIICCCCTHQFDIEKQEDGLIVVAVENIPNSPPSTAIALTRTRSLRSNSSLNRSNSTPTKRRSNVMETLFNLDTPSEAKALTRTRSLRSNSSSNRRDSTPTRRTDSLVPPTRRRDSLVPKTRRPKPRPKSFNLHTSRALAEISTQNLQIYSSLDRSNSSLTRKDSQSLTPCFLK